MRLLTVLLALLCCATAGERQPVSPGTIKPIGPYSPGILTRDFLYVSGQGAKNPEGQIPADAEGQLRQCFENVKAVAVAAGLTMEHAVYAQVYLTNPADDGALDRVWKEYFPKSPPARSTIVVSRLPDTPVEMTVVAVRELSHKKTVAPPGSPASSPYSPGVIAEDRMYLSGFLGRDGGTGRIPEDPAAQVGLALDNMQATLKAAGLDFRNMVFVNPYLTDKMPAGVMNRAYASRFEFGNTPARATIQVTGLPGGASIEFAGVAVMDLAKRRAVRPKNMAPSPTASPCVFAGDALFCSAKSGFIPGVNGGIFAGTVETQLRQTMRNLLDGLEEAGMTFANVVASNVYLDNLDEFTPMNRVYAEYFTSAPPSRTTVQQLAPGKRAADARERWPTLEQISIIAVQ
jgi:enamine deaminase RidA (YjgF/YER057c/UK114 family)